MTRTDKKINQVTFNVGYLALSYCVILISYNNAVTQYRAGEHLFSYLLCIMPIVASCIPLVIDALAKKDLISLEKDFQQGKAENERVVEDFIDRVKLIKAMPVIASLFSLGFTVMSGVFLLNSSIISGDVFAIVLLSLSSMIGGTVSIFVLKQNLEKLNIDKKVKA